MVLAALLEPVPCSWVWSVITLLDALGGNVVVVLVDPLALLVVGVDLVAVLPLDDEAESVNAAQESHGSLLVALFVAQHGLTDVGGMAPHDGPEVLLGVALELASLEEGSVVASFTGDFEVAFKVHALVDVSDQAVLDLAEPSVELVCMFGVLTEVVVENNRSGHLQAGHEVLW